ncbi:probable LRR receptor-like serine/threonine-protein kinase At1g06840 [Neltuma alba]|uniref:probable LRR receptor-like serine/threonine-protein kinase At1g06840 n=1 Tax=Neltuma alba TaxID=207710 RepID=UPI0010A335CC|nr:probable LRR receptor-like serine/threonine-protein kinase At1g06840 [Prosopis alba]
MLCPRLYGFGLAFSFCCFILTAAAQKTNPSEVNALVQIKKSLIDPKNHLRNWNKGDPCRSNWTGVWCFDKAGTDGYSHVHELYLMTLNLSGSLAHQLGQLSRLQILNFMWNDLTGTIPKEIGNIKSLKLLLLNGNKLSGALPDELGNLLNLNRFQVDQNQLSGPIPPSFGNMVNVKHLHLNNNSFTGQIPRELSKLNNLLHLLVDNNNFSGHLPPEFSMLPALRILQVDNNNFSGTEIPSTYANFSKLVKLSLRNCSLQGAVPDLSSIKELTYLDLSWNHLSGPIPAKKLADNMTTIDLSNNRINGSIAESFKLLPLLQKLSLANNSLSGSIPASIWLNMSFSRTAKLTIDLRNNSFSDILGSSSLPANVTLRLAGNPICKNSNIQNIGQYCASDGVESDEPMNSTTSCPAQACPTDDFYEYVPASPDPCYCAAPLRIGYRLKSPSFSYFPPYRTYFESYLTQSLDMNLYQVWIDSIAWEAGPRLRMYLKLYPNYNDSHSNKFNTSEVRRLQAKFGSWNFPRTDLFGPYELLNFTLLGPYEHLIAETSKRKISTTVLVVAIIAAIACATTVSAIVTLVIAKRHIKYRSKLSRNHMSSNISIKIDGVKAFTFKELAHATDNFSSSAIVGQGGYGKVYKGILSDKTVVAIKRVDEGSLQGQKEFLTEIELLSRLHHRNLVSLVGYCNEEGEQILVYEFMPNGTLREWISGKRKGNLNFGMRLRVAMGASKGILYLHTEANPPIFHRDIKASNILLDRTLVAKVADFGLSRLAPNMDDEGNTPKYVSTVVRGTPGYLDPEYFLTHKLTDKSDVYSLGIVFLELLTSMQPISHGKNIVREVSEARQCGTISSIIDSKIGSYPLDCAEKFLNLALSCCHEDPEERPSMADVVRELEIMLSMLPDSETAFPDSASDFPIKMASSSSTSSTSYMARDGQNITSPMLSGSNLVSDVIPTIAPR